MGAEGLFSIAGKTAVVTGGAQGVGLMLARGFVEAGAKVYIAALEADACEKAAAELSEVPGGGKCVSLPADLSTEDGCRELADALRKREDSLDILVNNAGVPGPFSMHRYTHDAWRKVMAVNLEATFYLTRDLLPMLRAASREGDPSRVLNMGSVRGLQATDEDTFGYTASKAALHHLTAHLAKRVAPAVTVNAIAPFAFNAGIMKAVLKMTGRTIAEATPLKRIGRPEDLVGVAIYLTSRAGAFVTGSVIPVDGGITTTA